MSDEFSAEELAALSPPAQNTTVPETAAETPAPVSAETERRGSRASRAEKSAPDKSAEHSESEGKTVALATLLEERGDFKRRHDEAETRRTAERAEWERKFGLLAQRMAEAQAPQPNDRAPQERFQRHQAAQVQRSQIAGHVGREVEQFKTATPDYTDAYRHLRQSMVGELRGMGVADSNIPKMLANAEFNIAAAALKSGRNPGQATYEAARARGYASGAARTDGGRQLETIERGQNAAKSLGNAGGAAPAGRLSLDTVLSMSDAEIANLKPDEFRRIFG